MDVKNNVDLLGIQKIKGKIQELGEKAHGLSERPIVSIS